MKRLLRPAAALCGALIVGSSLTACTVSPPAARVNGETVSMSMVNSVLRSLTATKAGSCFLAVEAQGQSQTTSNGAGTYTTGFSDEVVDQTVADHLYAQLAAERHLHSTAASLAQARTSLEGQLTQGITSLLQSGQPVPQCETGGPNPTALTGSDVLAGLPAAYQSMQVKYVEAENLLLADGVDLSQPAVTSFYTANKDQFTNACVSQLTVGTLAAAQAAIAKLNGGASFASVVAADSIDPQEQAAQGSVGCNQTVAYVAQQLQLSSVTAGQPIGPMGPISTPTGSSAYFVYEVTSEQLQPLAQVESQVRTDILGSSTNQNRVAAEVLAFAGRSTISVDPRFGRWNASQVVPPKVPPSSTLLAAVGGTQPSSTGAASPALGPLGAG